MYRKCKIISNSDAMISKRRSYMLANRKQHMNISMNKTRDYIIWLQIVPNPFGEKLKQLKSNDPKLVRSVTIISLNILKIYIQIVMGLVMMM